MSHECLGWEFLCGFNWCLFMIIQLNQTTWSGNISNNIRIFPYVFVTILQFEYINWLDVWIQNIQFHETMITKSEAWIWFDTSYTEKIMQRKWEIIKEQPGCSIAQSVHLISIGKSLRVSVKYRIFRAKRNRTRNI